MERPLYAGALSFSCYNQSMLPENNTTPLKSQMWAMLADAIEGGGDAFAQFQKTYRDDRVAFVMDCVTFGKNGPADYQLEIVGALDAYKRVAVRGPHGIGKTALSSWMILHGILTADDVKIPTTASAWRQLTKYLWPEVHKWAQRLNWQKIGRPKFNANELLVNNLKRGVTAEAFAVASSDPAFIEGAHAEVMFYVFDEAKAIPDPIWDAAEGAFTTAEAFALAISTPGVARGRFYDIHVRKKGYEDWHAIHVTRDQAIAAGRMPIEWAEQRARQWGIESPIYQNRVLGEFVEDDHSGVIGLAQIMRAFDRWHMLEDSDGWGRFIGVGVDVARFGNDATALALRFEGGIRRIDKYYGLSIPETANKAAAILAANTYTIGDDPAPRQGYAIVDADGLGAGVYDHLKSNGFKVKAFHGGGGKDLTDKSREMVFANRRAQAVWKLREALDIDADPGIALPPDEDDELLRDLMAYDYTETDQGKIKMISKDVMRKDLGRSPDLGDAVFMAMYDQKRWLVLPSKKR